MGIMFPTKGLNILMLLLDKNILDNFEDVTGGLNILMLLLDVLGDICK